jgi:hypothetical protein
MKLQGVQLMRNVAAVLQQLKPGVQLVIKSRHDMTWHNRSLGLEKTQTSCGNRFLQKLHK